MAKKGNLTGNFETINELVRPERARKYKYLFLIVCEDENTEREYFEQFKAKIPEETIFLKAVGTGKDPKGVVQQAVKEKIELEAICGKEVDVTWVVFDKDDADLNEARRNRFKDAFDIGNENKFKFAFSNEVFELWLLLHLTDIDPNIPLPRANVYELLQSKIREHKGYENFNYKHGDSEVLNVIRQIGDEQEAFARAEALIQFHGSKDLLLCNPVTHVNKLVSELYEWVKYWSYHP